MAGAGFEFVDTVDGAEIDGVDGKTVEGVGGEGHDVAAVETGDDLIDELGLGLVGMDTKDFSRQIWLLCRVLDLAWNYVLRSYIAVSHLSIPPLAAQ